MSFFYFGFRSAGGRTGGLAPLSGTLPQKGFFVRSDGHWFRTAHSLIFFILFFLEWVVREAIYREFLRACSLTVGGDAQVAPAQKAKASRVPENRTLKLKLLLKYIVE